jgi:hypothetical protein
MTVAAIAAEPDRHALVMPDCECGRCTPTWRAGLVSACGQTVTAATLAAAGCLVGMVEAVQALSLLAG